MPGVDTLANGVSFIEGQVEEGRVVLVHCLAGEGRTGCVLAAYLVKERRVGADEAIRTLRQVKPAFVEWPQEKAIFDYAAFLRVQSE